MSQMSLKEYLNKKVIVVTNDGRTFTGELVLWDTTANAVLSDCWEIVIQPPDSEDSSSKTRQGLYMIRGDTIAVLGEVNEELDAQIDWTKVRGTTLINTKQIV